MSLSKVKFLNNEYDIATNSDYFTLQLSYIFAILFLAFYFVAGLGFHVNLPVLLFISMILIVLFVFGRQEYMNINNNFSEAVLSYMKASIIKASTSKDKRIELKGLQTISTTSGFLNGNRIVVDKIVKSCIRDPRIKRYIVKG